MYWYNNTVTLYAFSYYSLQGSRLFRFIQHLSQVKHCALLKVKHFMQSLPDCILCKCHTLESERNSIVIAQMKKKIEVQGYNLPKVTYTVVVFPVFTIDMYLETI